jgi:hypothetical protein
MKKSYVLIFVLVLISAFVFGQENPNSIGGRVDQEATEAAEKGIDMMSLGIGLLIGLIGGYFIGSKMGNKVA